LTNGFLQGYNTLDALAALAFGITVVTAIKGFKIKEGKETSLAKTGAISFAGIAIIYLILVALGAGSLHYFKLSENGGIAFAKAPLPLPAVTCHKKYSVKAN
jgi:LIVCS family branched-chain amino acid:cation transporter